MILGHPSAAELEDLIKAKDYTLGQLQRHWMVYGSTWTLGGHGAEASAWAKDFAALQARYDTARDAALRKIANARVEAKVEAGALETLVLGPLAGVLAAREPPDLRLVPAQDEWDGVLKALRQAYDPATESGPERPGDLSDLDRRLTVGTGHAPDYSHTPQPKVESDADLNLFKKADVALRAAGVLPPSPGQFPWVRVIAGGVAGGVVGVYLLPHYLLQLAAGGATAGWLSTKPWTRW